MNRLYSSLSASVCWIYPSGLIGNEYHLIGDMLCYVDTNNEVTVDIGCMDVQWAYKE